MSDSVFLLIGGVGYDDSCEFLRAFTTKEEADTLRSRMEQHAKARPNLYSDGYNRKNLAKYDKSFDDWHKANPLGQDVSEIDFYSVVEVPFYNNKENNE